MDANASFKIYTQNSTFELISDFIRCQLNILKPSEYRYGTNYTDIDALIRVFISQKSFLLSHLYYSNCKITIES